MRLYAAALLLTLTACGDKPGANETIMVEGNAANGAEAVQAAPAETRGQDFVATVLGALAFETLSAKPVAAKAGRPDVRAFAQSLDTALGAATRDLTSLAQQQGLKSDPLAGPTHQSDLAVLSSTQGAPLDLAFLNQQQIALTELLGTIRAYKNGGDNPALQGWAERNQAIIAEQLNTVQTLKAIVNDAMNGE